MSDPGFPFNCWYVAALPEEVAARPLARRILGLDLVIYRTESGRVAALEDRCAHRLAPLSMGSVVGEHLRCGYHGAEFAADGRCVCVPGQDQVPERAQVRSFPARERYGFVWVWPGDPELAAQAEPCDLFAYIEHGSWGTQNGYIRIECNFLLVNDNLADVSHTEFVHASTLGSRHARSTRMDGLPLDQQGQHTFESELVDGGIDFRLRMNNTRLAPTFENAFLRARGAEGCNTLDFQLDYMFRAPAFWIFRPTTLKSGAPLEDGIRFDGLIALTPETSTACHYFHKSCQGYAPGDAAETAYWHEQTTVAFLEDKHILEAQQRNLGSGDIPDYPHVSFRGDRLGFLARRMIQNLVAAERSGVAD